MKVILLCGEHDNLTLSSIFFDRWGSSTHQQVTECNSWQEGVKQAGDGLLVFVRSGCIFSDWFEFRDTIKNYPPKLKLPHPLFARSSYPPAHNLVWKTHADAIEMSAWCWLVHLCGRASPRMIARAAAS